MRKQILLIALLVFSLFLIGSVSATYWETNILTTNGTEFNTATPTFNVNVTGNCSSFYVNLTIGNLVGGTVDVLTNQVVNNATATDIIASTSTTAGSYRVNITAFNNTCEAGLSNSSKTYETELNARPYLSSVTATGGALLVGKTVTFTTAWTDQNSTGTDGVQIFVCKTNAFTTSCTGGQWASSSEEVDNSTSPTYTILTSDTGGTKQAYVFALDNNNYSSAVNQTSFLVSRPIEGETVEVEETTQAKEKGNKGFWIVGGVILVVILFVVFRKD